jgi:hypothetical protein
MYHFHYIVRTKATPDVAWGVFSNWNLWRHFASIYGEMNWVEGRPWEVGSRMRIEVLRPGKAQVDRLIICCEPAREVGWIDKACGLTLDQWVEFEMHPLGGTRVRTWGDLGPSEQKLGGRSAPQLFAEFTETWFENFRLACDELAMNRGTQV